ncbi:MAG: VaFE repeat-containing surface-anchored protein [Dorea sp.]
MTDKNNRKITGRTTFTPEKSAGTVEMTFELDARELGERLWYLRICMMRKII